MLRKVLFAAFLSFSSFAFAGPVDINTADVKALDKNLEGVGPAKAAAIVNYRNQNGLFKSVDDLAKVKGISKKIVEQNRSKITIKTDVSVKSDS